MIVGHCTHTISTEPTLGGQAPQHTDSTKDTAADVNTTASSGKPSTSAVEPTSATTSTPHDTATASEPSADTQPEKKGGIGSSSWFSTAIPFIGGKNKAAKEEPKEEATVAGATATGPNVEEQKNLPPNHLPSSVPEGQSTDLETPAATGTENPLAAAALAEGSKSAESATDSSAPPPPESSDSLPGASGPRASTLPGTHASRTEPTPGHSEAKDKHRENPSAIPVAGGKKLGEAAEEERKASGVGDRPRASVDTGAASPATGAASSATGASSAASPPPSEGPGKSSMASDRSGASAAEGEGEGKEGKKHRNPLSKIKEKLKH